ncbi:MAG: hypothetical protein CMJ46_11880 [Planctomyces sp.]|nr:hypothetical protein [Planctomyces sp.]
MHILKTTFAALAASSLLTTGLVRADWIELTNNDVVSGEVISLNDKEVKIKSENFGEMTVPREKVGLIGLGDRPEPSEAPAITTETPSALSPNMNNAQMNRLLQEVLKGRDVQDMQKNIDESRKGLRDLQKDLDGPSAGAIDSYLQMLDFIGSISPDLQPQQNQGEETPDNSAPRSNK